MQNRKRVWLIFNADPFIEPPALIEVTEVAVRPALGLPHAVRDRLLGAALWGVIASACLRAFGLLGSVATSRILGMESFGRLSLVNSTTNLVSVYAMLGLGVTATKLISEHRVKAPERAKQLYNASLILSTTSSLLIAMIYLILTPSIAVNVFQAPGLVSPLRLGAVSIFLAGVNGVQTGALIGCEAFRQISIANITAGILGTPALIYLTYTFGINGSVAGASLVLFLSCLLNGYFLRRLGFKMDMHESRGFGHAISFGTPVLLSSLIASPAGWIVNTFVLRHGDPFRALAILNVADQWKQIINYIPLTVSSSLVPVIISLRSTSKGFGGRNLGAYQVGFAALAALALSVPVALASPLILRAYGPGYKDGDWIFAIVILTTVILATANSTSLLLQALGKPWLEFGAHAIWALSFVLFAACLIPRYGAVGVAYAMAGSSALQLAWHTLVFLRLRQHQGA